MNRVLIIEDDAVTRRQLVQLFRFEQFEVDEAASGEAGIIAATAAAPDLVVCDIMMPGIDGFGVLEALRRRPDTALTPFIFLTAKAGGRDIRNGMNQGADDYITKPFDPDALLASARQRLGRRRLQLDEAARQAANTGMLAAATLPREMESSLAHMEALSEDLLANYNGDIHARHISTSLKREVAQLRAFSQRLRLYSELPSLYARRFEAPVGDPAGSSAESLANCARNVAKQWSRANDLTVCAGSALIPLPQDSAFIIVRELVDNACKFSSPSTPILVESRQERGYWRLHVVDRGRGMLSGQIERIGAFKQFWSGSERPAGLGIGLVLAQTIVCLHSGEVQIESEPGSGTRVTVMVPAE